MAISRNLEKDTLYINRFLTGLYTQRSPLFSPLSAMGLQVITRLDTLWDGSNTDLSSSMSLIRRPGFARYCDEALTTDEIALAFFSFKNTSGTIKALVDTNQRVAYFDDTSITDVYTKGSNAQTSFTKVGDVVYMCNGTDAKQWDGTTLNTWGVVPPATAPTLSLVSGSLTTFSGYGYAYTYLRSGTGEVSSASPVSANTLPFSSKTIDLTGAYSDDTSVDKVQIYRTLDGGTVYYYVAEIDNNSSGSDWNYTDTAVDTALNNDVVAPLAHINDPVPSGASLSCFYAGRVWVAADKYLYFGGGSQITNGVPETCFPPANVFTMPGKVVAMLPTSAGLAVWTEDNFYVVLGTDLASFSPQLYEANFGVPNQNCVVQDGDLLFFFTSKGQLFTISSNLQEIGFNIRGRLAAFDPSKVSLTLHRAGADEGLFISNGANTIYRYSVAQTCWSNSYDVVGGAGRIGSIEVATADYRLMLGRATATGHLLARSLTTFQDDGSSYAASAVVGSLMLSPPGQTTPVQSILMEAMPVGTYPTISVLLNEISGTFSALPNPVPDPPALPASTTVWQKRHYLASAQTPLPRKIRHMQVKITFATEAAANEVIGMAVQGE